MSEQRLAPSTDFQQCVALYHHWLACERAADADVAAGNTSLVDRPEFNPEHEAFFDAVDRFIAAGGTSPQRLGELTALYRLYWWNGDEKIGHGDQSEKLERTIWQSIETLTGVTVPADSAP